MSFVLPQPPASLPFIVSQLAESCATLWEHRERAANVIGQRATFEDLERLDDRIDAQLDGLLVSGQEGWQAAMHALDAPDPGEIFAASAFALSSTGAGDADRSRLEMLLGTVRHTKEAVRPMAMAFDWASPDAGDVGLAHLAADRSGFASALIIIIGAMRGIEARSRIVDALESGRPLLVRAACAAATSLRLADLVERMEQHLTHRDIETRAAAATAALFLGSRRAKGVLVEMAAADPGSALADLAATTLFRSVSPTEAVATHRDVFGRHAGNRASLKAAGAAGVRELVPMVLEHVDSPPVARVAAEAFTLITGARDLGDPARETPRSVEREGWDDPGDEQVDLDPDEGVPWPSVSELAAWWHGHRSAFDASTRYLDGLVVTDASLKRLIGEGSQSRRLAAADLTALRGWPRPDVCAPAFRQRERLRMGRA